MFYILTNFVSIQPQIARKGNECDCSFDSTSWQPESLKLALRKFSPICLMHHRRCLAFRLVAFRFTIGRRLLHLGIDFLGLPSARHPMEAMHLMQEANQNASKCR